MLETSCTNYMMLADAQAELTGDFRLLCMVIQHSDTGEHAFHPSPVCVQSAGVPYYCKSQCRKRLHGGLTVQAE